VAMSPVRLSVFRNFAYISRVHRNGAKSQMEHNSQTEQSQGIRK
jgi:hypothetical protein